MFLLQVNPAYLAEFGAGIRLARWRERMMDKRPWKASDTVEAANTATITVAVTVIIAATPVAVTTSMLTITITTMLTITTIATSMTDNGNNNTSNDGNDNTSNDGNDNDNDNKTVDGSTRIAVVAPAACQFHGEKDSYQQRSRRRS